MNHSGFGCPTTGFPIGPSVIRPGRPNERGPGGILTTNLNYTGASLISGRGSDVQHITKGRPSAPTLEESLITERQSTLAAGDGNQERSRVKWLNKGVLLCGCLTSQKGTLLFSNN